MILTQILIYTTFNTLYVNNVVVHRLIRKALHSLAGARVISTFNVRIETAAIVFNDIESYMFSVCLLNPDFYGLYQNIHSEKWLLAF